MPPTEKVLVTGANGFVGRAVCKTLLEAGYVVHAATRQPLPLDPDSQLIPCQIGNIDGETDWSAALDGCSFVIHLAARTHVLRETDSDPTSAYRSTNTAGTINLAQQAAKAGVRRFIFLSSIKVNGEGRNAAYTEKDDPNPQDDYGRSKWEAEQQLRGVAANVPMDVTILRPPLVYGPHVGANFLQLMKIVDRSIPLPFGNVQNQRSILYVENLADLIKHCLNASSTSGETFLVDDSDPLSTPDLVQGIATALKRAPRLIPFPLTLVETAARMVGQAERLNRLTGSLHIDRSHLTETLKWQPPYTMAEGLQQTADWYTKEVRRT